MPVEYVFSKGVITWQANFAHELLSEEIVIIINEIAVLMIKRNALK